METQMSEATRRTIEITKLVEEADAKLPVKGLLPRFVPVTFEKVNASDGWSTVFFAGPCVASGKKDVLYVPKRTCEILEVLGIPYRILEEKELSGQTQPESNGLVVRRWLRKQLPPFYFWQK